MITKHNVMMMTSDECAIINTLIADIGEVLEQIKDDNDDLLPLDSGHIERLRYLIDDMVHIMPNIKGWKYNCDDCGCLFNEPHHGYDKDECPLCGSNYFTKTKPPEVSDDA